MADTNETRLTPAKLANDAKLIANNLADKVKRNTLALIMACFVICLIGVIWSYVRLSHSQSNDAVKPNFFIALVYFLAYFLLMAVSGGCAYGIHIGKPRFIYWFIMGTIVLVTLLSVNLFYSLSIQSTCEAIKKPGILSILFTVFSIIVFSAGGISAYFLHLKLENANGGFKGGQNPA